MNEPCWKLWRNPLIRRFATARLRWVPLVCWSVVLQAVAAFLWLSIYYFYREQQHFGVAASALRAWVPILVLQAVLWLMKGTFSVATGIAREGIEGLTEAQILTPLTPWQKTLGYLIGLPILETVLVLSLLPWTAVSVIKGHIPVAIVLRVHLLLLTSALLHHSIGLVAGTVIRHKIVAGTVSQLIVIGLHAILPLLAQFGLGPLGHLGIGLAVAYELAPLWQSGVAITGGTVRFFRWELSLSGYQWVVMALLLGGLLTVLRRRWQRPSAHLLGRPMALGFFAWILLLSLGEIYPRLHDGSLLGRMAKGGASEAQPLVPLAWVAGFGSLGLLVAMLLSSSIAATLEEHWRALRASRRSASARLLWLNEARSALPWGIALAAILLAAWTPLIRELLALPVFHFLATPTASMPWLLGAGISLPLFAWIALVELRGLAFACMAVFLLWVVPPMVATVAVLAGAEITAWPRWCLALSGFALPPLSLLQSFTGIAREPLAADKFRLVWEASLSLHALAVLFLSIQLQAAKGSIFKVSVVTVESLEGKPAPVV